MEEKYKNLQESVLKKINLDNLKMRPRVYFSVKLALVTLVTALVALTSALIFDFLLFHLGESGRTILLHFGPRGYFSFLRFFPWVLAIIDILLIFFLVWLLRQFSFGYRNPLLYLLLCVLLITFTVGTVVKSRTNLNERIMAHHGGLPSPFSDFFDGARRPPLPEEGVCRCTITKIEGNTITAEEAYSTGASTTRTIILPFDSDDATSTGLKAGDVIFVVGNPTERGIEAYGLRPVFLERRLAPPRY